MTVFDQNGAFAFGVDILYFLQADEVGIDFFEAAFEFAQMTATGHGVGFVDVVGGDSDHGCALSEARTWAIRVHSCSVAESVRKVARLSSSAEVYISP